MQKFFPIIVFAGVLIGLPLIVFYVIAKGSPLHGILIAGWAGVVVATIVAAAVIRRLRKRRP